MTSKIQPMDIEVALRMMTADLEHAIDQGAVLPHAEGNLRRHVKSAKAALEAATEKELT